MKQVQVTNSTAMDIFPSFSPDGSMIAYSSNVGGSFEIYIKQLAPGGRTIQLTSGAAENLQAAWSPDGKVIAYYSRIHGGIWIMPALGGVARQLTDFGSGPSWSPDGAELVFQSEGIRDLSATASVSVTGSTLWAVSLRDGSTRQVTRSGVVFRAAAALMAIRMPSSTSASSSCWIASCVASRAAGVRALRNDSARGQALQQCGTPIIEP